MDTHPPVSRLASAFVLLVSSPRIAAAADGSNPFTTVIDFIQEMMVGVSGLADFAGGEQVAAFKLLLFLLFFVVLYASGRGVFKGFEKRNTYATAVAFLISFGAVIVLPDVIIRYVMETFGAVLAALLLIVLNAIPIGFMYAGSVGSDEVLGKSDGGAVPWSAPDLFDSRRALAATRMLVSFFMLFFLSYLEGRFGMSASQATVGSTATEAAGGLGGPFADTILTIFGTANGLLVFFYAVVFFVELVYIFKGDGSSSDDELRPKPSSTTPTTPSKSRPSRGNGESTSHRSSQSHPDASQSGAGSKHSSDTSRGPRSESSGESNPARSKGSNQGGSGLERDVEAAERAEQHMEEDLDDTEDAVANLETVLDKVEDALSNGQRDMAQSLCDEALGIVDGNSGVSRGLDDLVSDVLDDAQNTLAAMQAVLREAGERLQEEDSAAERDLLDRFDVDGVEDVTPVDNSFFLDKFKAFKGTDDKTDMVNIWLQVTAVMGKFSAAAKALDITRSDIAQGVKQIQNGDEKKVENKLESIREWAENNLQDEQDRLESIVENDPELSRLVSEADEKLLVIQELVAIQQEQLAKIIGKDTSSRFTEDITPLKNHVQKLEEALAELRDVIKSGSDYSKPLQKTKDLLEQVEESLKAVHQIIDVYEEDSAEDIMETLQEDADALKEEGLLS